MGPSGKREQERCWAEEVLGCLWSKYMICLNIMKTTTLHSDYILIKIPSTKYMKGASLSTVGPGSCCVVCGVENTNREVRFHAVFTTGLEAEARLFPGLDSYSVCIWSMSQAGLSCNKSQG